MPPSDYESPEGRVAVRSTPQGHAARHGASALRDADDAEHRLAIITLLHQRSQGGAASLHHPHLLVCGCGWYYRVRHLM